MEEIPKGNPPVKRTTEGIKYNQPVGKKYLCLLSFEGCQDYKLHAIHVSSCLNSTGKAIKRQLNAKRTPSRPLLDEIEEEPLI